MSDIFGRSTIAPTDGITRRQITSMIKRYIASGLNLVDVDPGEIVVFGDKQGKLKTSNLSLDDLLTKPKDAADNSIAVFKSGKITAGDKLSSITSSVKQLRNEYEAHVVNYATLRKNFNTADNTIEKFFGKKNIKPDEVTTTLPDLKKSIEDSASAIKDIKAVTDKVNIPHDANDVKGIPYVVSIKIGSDHIFHDESKIKFGLSNLITGIYRISVISEHQFNIEASEWGGDPFSEISTVKGINTVLMIIRNPPIDNNKNNLQFRFFRVDSTVVRAKFGYIVEYLSPI